MAQTQEINIPVADPNDPYANPAAMPSSADRSPRSFDVDAFSSAVMPATGTPDPAGLGWYEAVFLLEHAIRGRNVIGFDVVELAPYPGFHSSDLAAAKLTYNIMGIISRLGIKK